MLYLGGKGTVTSLVVSSSSSRLIASFRLFSILFIFYIALRRLDFKEAIWTSSSLFRLSFSYTASSFTSSAISKGLLSSSKV
jgi:hypothetical protein